MPKRQITQLLLFVFIDVIGYSLFFSLLPYYAGQFGAGASLVGLMIASNAGAQFLAAPLIGRLSDRYGRRPLIMVSIIGTLLSFLLLAFVGPVSEILASNLGIFWPTQPFAIRAAGWAIVLLFFCRILDGLAGGNISLARAYVADITTEAQRAQGLGLIGAAFGFAFVIGPAIGGTLSNWPAGVRWMEAAGLSRFAIPALAAVGIAFVNLVGVYLMLPESLPAHGRASSLTRITRPQSAGGVQRSMKRRLAKLLGLRLIFSLAITLFMANFALFTQNYLAFSDRATSYVLTYAGLLLILVQAGGVGWLARRFSEMKIVLFCTVIVAASLICLSLSSGVVSLMLILFPLAISGGAINTIINSLISKAADKDQVGGALGLATSLESLAWVIAPIIGGTMIEYFGGAAFSIVAGLFAGLLIPYIKWFLLPDPIQPSNLPAA